MSIENIIRETVYATRCFFNLKSYNKSYKESVRVQLPAYKRQLYSPENSEMRGRLLAKTRDRIKPMHSPYERNTILHSIQSHDHVGNCGEHSCKALEYLVEKSKLIWAIYRRPFDIIMINLNSDISLFDHQCVILSYNYPQQPEYLPNLPDLFNQHQGAEIWVCDPWANIACLSHNYPIEWKKKMHKWSNRGKLLCYGQEDINPIDPRIYRFIEQSNASVMFREHVDFTPYHLQ
ncbi:hypothetical protein FE392_13330 [Xenorhabdus sp. 12]|uniref:Uncharacterized protein n=1 Tax=Xenorhabdus santafensis TaxID=2582833 RepID=A0ABU4SBZ0_9GAMM|nr:hypothetical protein [Xenorhabdus sp. 12]MDX7988303.1 hypothetical protein [Xenorhabdus sp. 12]